MMRSKMRSCGDFWDHLQIPPDSGNENVPVLLLQYDSARAHVTLPFNLNEGLS